MLHLDRRELAALTTEDGRRYGVTGSIGAAVGLRRLKGRLGWPLLPDLLIVVVAAAALVRALRLDEQGVAVVGDIPAKLPGFAWPSLDPARVRHLSTAALSIAVLLVFLIVGRGEPGTARVIATTEDSADIVVLDPTLQLQRVLIEGEPLDDPHA